MMPDRKIYTGLIITSDQLRTYVRYTNGDLGLADVLRKTADKQDRLLAQVEALKDT